MAMKRLLSNLLLPLAIFHSKLQKSFYRVWAYSKLRASIRSPIDSSIIILGVAEIQGTANITLGKNLYLYRELYFETQASGKITIGDSVVISRGVHLVAFSYIRIGHGVMIGEYCSIRDANHRLSKTHNMRNTGHDSQPINIAENVWIGRGATILPGVTIGKGAVIGANAVVTKDIPEHSIALGIPAKVIRTISE